MVFRCALVACFLTLACTQKRAAAIRVDVTVKEAVKADCIEVSIFDSDKLLTSAVTERIKGKQTYVVGIPQGKLPNSIRIEASGKFGNCSAPETLKFNTSSELVAQFEPEAIKVVSITIDAPIREFDSDEDGYTDINSRRGGTDCNDKKNFVHPGVTEICDGPDDANCDGKQGCDDPACISTKDCLNPPTKVVLSAQPPTQVRYACIKLTATLHNEAGPRKAVRLVPITLSSSRADVAFFPNETCADPQGTSIQIMPASETISFGARLNGVGSATIVATATGPGNAGIVGSIDVESTPTAATQLALSGIPMKVTAGTCDALLEVEAQDVNGLATPTNGFPVTLAVSPVAAKFFAVNMCPMGVPITTVTIPDGGTRAGFVFSSEQVGTYRIGASALNGSLRTPDASIDVVGADLDKIALNPTSLNLERSACKRVDVFLRDRFNNLASVQANTTVTVSATDPAVTFTTDCAGSTLQNPIVAPMGVVSFGVQSSSLTTPGNPFVISVNSGSKSATLLLDVNSAVPNRFSFDGGIVAIAGACSPAFRVFLQDDAGAAASFRDGGVQITLTATPTPAGLQFFRGGTCPNGPIDAGARTFLNADESSFDLQFKSTQAIQPFAITASAAPITGAAANFGIVAAPPIFMVIDGGSPTVSAGVCTTTALSGSLFDQFMNAAKFASGATLTASPSQITIGAQSSCDAGALNLVPGQSTFSFSATSVVAGNYNVSLAGPNGLTSNTTPLRVIPSAIGGTNVVLTSPVGGVLGTKAGECATVELKRVDQLGNTYNANAQSVTVSAPVPVNSNIFQTPTLCSAGTTPFAPLFAADSGTLTLYLRSTSLIQDASVRFSIDADAGVLNWNVTPNFATSLQFATLPTTVVAGNCSDGGTVKMLDSFGNDTVLGASTARITAPGLQLYSPGNCAVAASGAQSVTLGINPVSSPFSFSSFDAGTKMVTASVMFMDGGQASVSASVLIVPAAESKLSIANKGVLQSPALRSGECRDVMLQIQDQFGNPVNVPTGPNKPIGVSTTATAAEMTFHTDPACMDTAPSNAGVYDYSIAAGQNSVKAYAKPIKTAFMKTITGTSAPLDSDSVMVNIGAGVPTKFVVSGPSLVTRFSCQTGALELRDSNDNLASTDAGATSFTLTGTNRLLVFPQAGCLPIPGATTASGMIPINTSQQPISYIHSSDTASLGVTGSGLGSSTLSVTTDGGFIQTLRLVPLSNELEAGGCVSLQVRRFESGTIPINRGVSQFELFLDGGATLHSDSNCTTAPLSGSTFQVFDGQQERQLYVRGHSVPLGTTPNLDPPPALTPTFASAEAVDTNDPGSFGMRSFSLVHSGSCPFGALQTAVSCDVTPFPLQADISRSFLVFSSSSTNSTPETGAVRCLLQGGSAVKVICDRTTSGQPIDVNFQVVSWGMPATDGGMSVIHRTGTLLPAATSDSVTIPSVAVGKSFVLISNKSTSAGFSHTEFVKATLSNATTVTVDRGASGSTIDYALQVVTLNNATIGRGMLPVAVASGALVSANVPVGAQTAPLASVSFSGAEPSVTTLCKRAFRAAYSGSNMNFSRGDTTTSCGDATGSISWETIALTPNVATPLTPLIVNVAALALPTNGVTLNSTVFAGVDINRSIVFMPMQGMGGQSGGETRSSTSEIGFSQARVEFVTAHPATIATVTRASSSGLDGGQAIFSPFVIQFAP
jgi:hypothetical protein